MRGLRAVRRLLRLLAVLTWPAVLTRLLTLGTQRTSRRLLPWPGVLTRRRTLGRLLPRLPLL
ncbi:hypothetical protein ABZV93_09565 [Actinopolymorpha sp. NPDC004070]|uniref:hypothetical protein n=1 Tax=Actinopolymorpha sp. NPDC004070 TaxID=3154548 RepID=UPI0033BF9B8D